MKSENMRNMEELSQLILELKNAIWPITQSITGEDYTEDDTYEVFVCDVCHLAEVAERLRMLQVGLGLWDLVVSDEERGNAIRREITLAVEENDAVKKNDDAEEDAA